MRYWLAVGIVAILCAAQFASAQGSKRLIQAELLKTIKAKKAKVGDVVKARAVQSVVLPGGITIPEGSTVVGEVRAVDENSLAMSFDQVEIKGKTTPVKLSIRAAMMPEQASFSAGRAPSTAVGHTGSVIGMPDVTLEVDEGPQHASKFTSSGKELQLKSGLELMLAVVE